MLHMTVAERTVGASFGYSWICCILKMAETLEAKPTAPPAHWCCIAQVSTAPHHEPAGQRKAGQMKIPPRWMEPTSLTAYCEITAAALCQSP